MVRVPARASLIAVAVLLLSACAGRSTAVPFPSESAYDTAVIKSLNNTCTNTYTVHRDGGAQRVAQNCGSDSGTKTVTLAPEVTSLFFSDLQAAQPLNALPACIGVDTSIAIAWNGQQSPSIGTCSASTPSEQALAYEIGDVIVSFVPVP